MADWFDALADSAPLMPAATRAASAATDDDHDKNIEARHDDKKHIEECIRDSLEAYFKDLRGVEPTAMYEMILDVVERPLLDVGDEARRRQPEPRRRVAGHQPQHAAPQAASSTS